MFLKSAGAEKALGGSMREPRRCGKLGRASLPRLFVLLLGGISSAAAAAACNAKEPFRCGMHGLAWLQLDELNRSWLSQNS